MPRKPAQECELFRPYLQALGSSKSRAPGLATPISGIKVPTRRVATLTTETVQPPLPVVIGTVYYARRILRVVDASKLDAQAKLSWGASFLQALGLGSSFKISAEGGSAASNAIEFVGSSVVPVAYAPAFEVGEIKAAEGGGETTVQVTEISPAEINLNVAVMEAFLKKNNLVARASRDPFGGMIANEVPGTFVLGRPPDFRS
jgi:hypothetical protein